METFRIAEDLVPTFKKRLLKIEGKANKLGSLPISVKEVGSDIEQTPAGPVPVRLFEIDGTAPKAQGWSFLATLDHTVESGVILRTVPGAYLPEEYRTAQPVCDHCQTVRRRKETFVVRHDATGEVKQVGRQCVRDFLGGNESPENVARMLQYVFDVESLLREASEGTGGFNGIAVEIGTSLSRFLAVTAAVIEDHGWVSRKDAYDFGKISTASEVLSLIDRARSLADYEQTMLHTSEKHNQLAEDAIEWARSLRNKDTLSDYEHNVAVVAEGGIVTTKLAGIAASIVYTYQRAKERDQTRKLRDSLTTNSIPLGAPKERIEATVSVLSIRTVEGSQFGPSFLVKMVTSNGCACCWFASSRPEMEENGVYRIKGTVKYAKEFNGVMETTLTRCAII